MIARVPRLFVPPEQLADSPRVTLTPAQARHLLSVLRLSPGAEIEVFDGSGGRFRALLADGSLEIGARLSDDRRPIDVALAQALIKGEKMDLVVQKATELGASRIVPFTTARTVPRLDPERGAARAERWRRIAQEGARQSGRADVPRVEVPLGWDALLAEARADADRRALLLDPDESRVRLGAAARGVSRLLLAVGPEGGFSGEERTSAIENGFVPVALGPQVLRTETAGLVALAVVLHVHGALG
jgi:16S rRNA (uracil1498-N3)-methyltransferase